MAGDENDEDALFLQAMRGVERIDRSDVRQRKQEGGGGPKRVGTPRPAASARVEVDREPGFVVGRARGVSERVVNDLRAGKRPVERKVDLHGQRRDVAVATVRGRVESAVLDGHRCLLFVHGRGKHSGGAPVLLDATIEALTTAPAVEHVRAFCTARPEHGGAGALYVLLARSKKK